MQFFLTVSNTLTYARSILCESEVRRFPRPQLAFVNKDITSLYPEKLNTIIEEAMILAAKPYRLWMILTCSGRRCLKELLSSLKKKLF